MQAQEREIELRIKQAAMVQKQRGLAEKEEMLAGNQSHNLCMYVCV
jgi:hypothetical protein